MANRRLFTKRRYKLMTQLSQPFQKETSNMKNEQLNMLKNKAPLNLKALRESRGARMRVKSGITELSMHFKVYVDNYKFSYFNSHTSVQHSLMIGLNNWVTTYNVWTAEV